MVRTVSFTSCETRAYAFVRHTDAPNPHVHLVVRALGADGERFSPKKDDLISWRESFAGALREEGIEADATPRRVRGLSQDYETSRLRRLRLAYERGEGPMPEVMRKSLQKARLEAALDAWEESILARSRRQTHAQDLNAEPSAGWKPGGRGQGGNASIETPTAGTLRAAVPGEAPAIALPPTLQRRRERDPRGEEHDRGR